MRKKSGQDPAPSAADEGNLRTPEAESRELSKRSDPYTPIFRILNDRGFPYSIERQVSRRNSETHILFVVKRKEIILSLYVGSDSATWADFYFHLEGNRSPDDADLRRTLALNAVSESKYTRYIENQHQRWFSVAVPLSTPSALGPIFDRCVADLSDTIFRYRKAYREYCIESHTSWQRKQRDSRNL